MKGISHRDLKIENILLDGGNNVKIADFGLSVFCSHDDAILNEGPNLNHTTVGTMSYMAPEVLKNEGYDGTLADVWSCGVILFFILTGRKPFENDDYRTE